MQKEDEEKREQTEQEGKWTEIKQIIARGQGLSGLHSWGRGSKINVALCPFHSLLTDFYCPLFIPKVFLYFTDGRTVWHVSSERHELL